MTQLCRTCEGVIYNRKAKNLFDKTNAEVLMNIELVSGLSLRNEPDLPTCICACCQLDLNHAIVFRERCIKTQERMLQSRLEEQIKYEETENDDLDIKLEIDQFGVPDDILDKDFDEVDELLGFPDTDEEEEKELNEQDLDQDAHALITSMQKELGSLCDDDCSETQDPPTPTPSPAPKSRSGVSADKPKSQRKQYMTWKNLTEEEIVERKRQQRRRDCVCEQCGRHFTDQSNFKLHMLRHTGVKGVECQDCGKKFYTEHLMSLHVRVVHNGERPYACKYCDKTFHNSTTRAIHVRTHTKVRPYDCGYCDKNFSSASGRKRHELIHTGIRDFYCDTCEHTFQRSSHLKAHLRSKQHLLRVEQQTIEGITDGEDDKEFLNLKSMA